jgi:hypothetical protein
MALAPKKFQIGSTWHSGFFVRIAFECDELEIKDGLILPHYYTSDRILLRGGPMVDIKGNTIGIMFAARLDAGEILREV